LTLRTTFFALLVFQILCTFVFFWRILSSLIGPFGTPIPWHIAELIEIGAALGLLVGVGMSAMLLTRSMKRQAEAEETVRIASGAFMDVIEQNFQTWALTPAERDVAMFAIKGLSTAEIAAVRNTSEGTVKAQTNAIYRKAGVSGRPQLLSLFIDELVSGEPLALRQKEAA
jgi:DNA-binding CsgD family transcriptional regulator